MSCGENQEQQRRLPLCHCAAQLLCLVEAVELLKYVFFSYFINLCAHNPNTRQVLQFVCSESGSGTGVRGASFKPAMNAYPHVWQLLCSDLNVIPPWAWFVMGLQERCHLRCMRFGERDVYALGHVSMHCNALFQTLYANHPVSPCATSKS